MKIVFRSKKKGLGRFLGALESEIMELLWKEGPLKGKEVHQHLIKRTDIALTTILTVLDRLSKKGFVGKERGTGVFIYSPALSKDEFKGDVTSELVRGAYELSPDFAISAFSDIFSKMKSEELDRLAQLIEEKRHENHKDD